MNRALARTLASLGSAATVGALAVVVAPQASADLVRCSSLGYSGSDGASLCATVINVDPGTTLKVRNGTSTSAPVVGEYQPGAVVEVDGCWAYGEPAADSPTGYDVWAKVYAAASNTHFVHDYYLSSGDIRSLLPEC